jgi:hypothetical protein
VGIIGLAAFFRITESTACAGVQLDPAFYGIDALAFEGETPHIFRRELWEGASF